MTSGYLLAPLAPSLQLTASTLTSCYLGCFLQVAALLQAQLEAWPGGSVQIWESLPLGGAPCGHLVLLPYSESQAVSRGVLTVAFPLRLSGNKPD